MNDMSGVIVPKSDQINADDLISGPRTITIKNVVIRSGQDQPVSVFFEGDNGKPFKPCKTMSKVLVHLWGPDADKYMGRSITLYRDPKVKWGGMEVGGIRISHASHIDGKRTLALTETKGRKVITIIEPLKISESVAPTVDKSKAAADSIIERVKAAHDLADVEAITGDDTVKRQRAWMREKRQDLADLVDAAVSEVLASFEIPDDMPGAMAAE